MAKVVVQNTSSFPIQIETIALSKNTTLTSPQNFTPFKQLTLGGVLYLYYDKKFKVVKTGDYIEILPADGKGWHKDTPGHKRAAAKNKLKMTLRAPQESNRESPEDVAARHIRESPNCRDCGHKEVEPYD